MPKRNKMPLSSDADYIHIRLPFSYKVRLSAICASQYRTLSSVVVQQLAPILAEFETPEMKTAGIAEAEREMQNYAARRKLRKKKRLNNSNGNGNGNHEIPRAVTPAPATPEPPIAVEQPASQPGPQAAVA